LNSHAKSMNLFTVGSVSRSTLVIRETAFWHQSAMMCNSSSRRWNKPTSWRKKHLWISWTNTNSKWKRFSNFSTTLLTTFEMICSPKSTNFVTKWTISKIKRKIWSSLSVHTHFLSFSTKRNNSRRKSRSWGEVWISSTFICQKHKCWCKT